MATSLKVKLDGSYRNGKATLVFRYKVSGDTESLAAYKAAQGEKNYREEEETGVPLWFTSRGIGSNGTLIITRNGKIVPDMSEFDMADSIAKQYGGNLGQSIAQEMASKLVGNLRVTQTQAAAVIAPKAEAPAEELNDDL